MRSVGRALGSALSGGYNMFNYSVDSLVFKMNHYYQVHKIVRGLQKNHLINLIFLNEKRHISPQNLRYIFFLLFVVGFIDVILEMEEC